MRGCLLGDGPGASVGKGARVGGVLEDGEDGGHGRLPPGHVAEAVAAGQQQVVVVEVADDLAGGAGAEEGVEDQRQAALDFPVGVLEDAVEWVTDQAGGEGQGQLTALGLVEQSGGQACPQRVHLQFRDQALEAEDQAAIGSRRVVNAVLVADEALAVATEVEELIPVGAVTGQRVTS